ncbi:ABC transporter ATP-binding protein [Lederbergia sp. NSJ-179]|uniref:ABC transporter ATP-binding protein n=1 Tax=Lederbergia sp. NSJ-179 TaxID=2931402 RepID=UPI001FD253A2|nr:ABC transporter ATP-binding protein [Lederbergia sp. NSJ-179]MCJ7842700.1 ABC transporter ATP-binding protein [Lederbergia sp. NSJ-179]
MKLKIENITHQYKDFYALKNVNCELSPGIYGLLGPNGAGKSTLMRILVDVIAPTKGRVVYNNHEISTLGSRYRDLLGYLPQNFVGYRHFTAEEFLNYVANLKGLDKQSAQIQVKQLLELVGLADVKRKKLRGFSGGMTRRVGIAQALLNDPDILILDEPTAGLDPSERIRLRGILSKLAKNKIIILSTHIVSDIEYVADEVLLLKDGEFIEKAPPNQLLDQLNNQVWQVQIADNQLAMFSAKYAISNVHQQGANIEIRLISQEKPSPSAINVEPRMEDLYVSYFGTQENSASFHNV